MPLYEYECDACGQRFELIRKFSDPAVDVCARCGSGPVRRLMSSPAIQFKGSGWYITDYAQKGKSGSDSGTKTGAESKPADSTPAAGESAGSKTEKTDTSTKAAASTTKD
jgi:putative FmdB family regulatory protein